MDSQWNKYQVFEQERADLPHRNAGSVHAPDAEMALENARDVFVRRPNCLSLWVIPESAIFARTAQELCEQDSSESERMGGAPETYFVFQKQGQTARETFVVHVGQVEAATPRDAMTQATEVFPSKNVFVWWVVPARAIIRNDTADAPSMFGPALDKPYRNHLSYPVEPIMRELKSAKEMLEQE